MTLPEARFGARIEGMPPTSHDSTLPVTPCLGRPPRDAASTIPITLGTERTQSLAACREHYLPEAEQ